MKLYNKHYELVIGESGKEGKKWTDLQVVFTIEKWGDSTPNKAEIEITNLSKSSREFIDREELVLIFKAGYKENYGQIFKGYTTFLNHAKGGERDENQTAEGFERKKKEDTDWKSKINAKDGLKALRDFYISESLSGDNITEKTVIEHLLKKLSLKTSVAKGTISGLSDKKINHGIALSGSFKSYMDRLTKNQGLKWFITDETIHIVPLNGAVSTEVIKLTPAYGLVHSPEKIETGWRFFCLLRHEFQPGTLFYAESEMVKGFFIAEYVKHTGDFDGTEWYTMIEAKPKK